MKKLLLFLLTATSLNSYSQSISEWYNYPAALSDLNMNIDYYRTHIFPDSTVQVEYSSGLGYTWMHGLGAVLDPTTYIFDNGTTQEVGATDPYYVDSVGFTYRYLREQQGAPDTLVIQFFKESNMAQLYPDPWAGDPQYGGRAYARIAFDTATRRGTTPLFEIVELLDNDDTTSVVDFMQFRIGEYIDGGEIVGATVTYLPGNPFNVNDTLDWEASTPPTNKINSFLMNYWVDNDLNTDADIYNHGIIATADSRYYDTTYSWQGQYWPGVASGGGLYHANISFKLTTTTGIEETEEAFLNAYPNPATDNITVELSETSEMSEILLQSIDGKTILSTQLFPGQTTVDLSVEQIKAGIYFIKHQQPNNVLAVKQIVIQ